MRKIRALLGGALLLVAGAPCAGAEEQRNYVLISDDAYAAFERAVFAAQARHDSEEKRLFSYGLKQAQPFIEAARAGRVSSDDWERIKYEWTFVLRHWRNFQPLDTSTDFVVGQVYQMIWDENTASLRNRSQDKVEYRDPARQDFSSHNCSLLGKRD